MKKVDSFDVAPDQEGTRAALVREMYEAVRDDPNDRCKACNELRSTHPVYKESMTCSGLFD